MRKPENQIFERENQGIEGNRRPEYAHHRPQMGDNRRERPDEGASALKGVHIGTWEAKLLIYDRLPRRRGLANIGCITRMRRNLTRHFSNNSRSRRLFTNSSSQWRSWSRHTITRSHFATSWIWRLEISPHSCSGKWDFEAVEAQACGKSGSGKRKSWRTCQEKITLASCGRIAMTEKQIQRCALLGIASKRGDIFTFARTSLPLNGGSVIFLPSQKSGYWVEFEIKLTACGF